MSVAPMAICQSVRSGIVRQARAFTRHDFQKSIKSQSMNPMTLLLPRRSGVCFLLVAGLMGLLTQIASAPAASAKPLPYIDENQQCRGQPLPATVEHLTGEAWKLDVKGKKTPLQEGMSIDEQEGVKTSPSAFVSLSLGDGSRVVLPSSSHITLHLNAKRPEGAEADEVQVMARQGVRIQKQGTLTPIDLLPAPRLLGQSGQTDNVPVWQLIMKPIEGATRYRAQVATDAAFLDIKQEQFSSTPEVKFSGLKAFFYHVRLSAYDAQGLEGEAGVYDIFYYPRTTHVQ